jgi:hypothetical protein
MESKYIKFRPNFQARTNGDDFYDFVVLFPAVVVHADILDTMQRDYTAISAGFFCKSANPENKYGYEAYGESTSTGLKSDPKKDNFLIWQALKGLE